MTTYNLTSVDQVLAPKVDETAPKDKVGEQLSGGEETGSTVSPPSPHSGAESGVENIDLENFLEKVPRDTEGKLLSIGSLSHAEGTCKPCVFAYNESRPCENGVHCGFCHYLHPPKKRVRLCKKKRLELKRLQEEHVQELALQAEQLRLSPPRSPPGLEDWVMSRAGGSPQAGGAATWN